MSRVLGMAAEVSLFARWKASAELSDEWFRTVAKRNEASRGSDSAERRASVCMADQKASSGDSERVLSVERRREM